MKFTTLKNLSKSTLIGLLSIVLVSCASTTTTVSRSYISKPKVKIPKKYKTIEIVEIKGPYASDFA